MYKTARSQPDIYRQMGRNTGKINLSSFLSSTNKINDNLICFKMRQSEKQIQEYIGTFTKLI